GPWPFALIDTPEEEVAAGRKAQVARLLFRLQRAAHLARSQIEHTKTAVLANQGGGTAVGGHGDHGRAVRALQPERFAAGPPIAHANDPVYPSTENAPPSQRTQGGLDAGPFGGKTPQQPAGRPVP